MDRFHVNRRGILELAAGGMAFAAAADSAIVSPPGKQLGRVITQEFPINMAFGGDDWKTLFIVTRTTLCAVKLKIPGESVTLRRA